jgi:hypothetical protein
MLIRIFMVTAHSIKPTGRAFLRDSIGNLTCRLFRVFYIDALTGKYGKT